MHNFSTLSVSVQSNSARKYLLDGAYANETRDPPGCDEQEVRS